MSSAVSYGSLKAAVLSVASNLTQTQGPLQQGLKGVEDQIAALQAIADGTSNAAVQEAIAMLLRAKESIEQAIWMVGAAQSSAEGAAAELS